ncbi:uncharacterized protein VTP21DRAFT_3221 [Calcarisporiella thermophila]|uniref:uncharacterized protein n=1 Tax=Calcarisporiella thermophila TaxID=911321 RepID=UPI00374358EA
MPLESDSQVCMICDHTHTGTDCIPSINYFDCESTSGEELYSDAGTSNQEEPSNKRVKLDAPVNSEIEDSTLVVDLEKFNGFPIHDQNDFYRLRKSPGLVYFDRTQYISTIENFTERVLLFLRPRRFGKSLTLSMLAYFHGLEHKKKYQTIFQDLAIDRDVQAKKIIPGQYLVLSFDFAGVNRTSDIGKAERELAKMINRAIGRFYRSYASYLGNKIIQIDYLDIPPSISQGHIRGQKALSLSNIIDTNTLVQLKFNCRDQFRPGQTIIQWVHSSGGPHEQLLNYWESPDITALRDKHAVYAYLVLIIGSRKILVWKMGNNSTFNGPILAGM